MEQGDFITMTLDHAFFNLDGEIIKEKVAEELLRFVYRSTSEIDTFMDDIKLDDIVGVAIYRHALFSDEEPKLVEQIVFDTPTKSSIKVLTYAYQYFMPHMTLQEVEVLLRLQ